MKIMSRLFFATYIYCSINLAKLYPFWNAYETSPEYFLQFPLSAEETQFYIVEFARGLKFIQYNSLNFSFLLDAS